MANPLSLSRSRKLDWLRLIRSENVGPRTFRRLLATYGDPALALAHLPDLARKGGKSRPIRICPLPEAEREMDNGETLGLTLITAACSTYPPALATIDDSPPILWAGGDTGLLIRPMIAMVGARNASLNGRNLTRRIAADLGRAGVVVASGLARGIDTAAHEGSLSTGTVAVMAGGADVVYPPENLELHRAILAAGCVLSEMAPGTTPQASHFPRRNRIVSGLALGVVVVEAALGSGSLITARLALEQGREVFAVPGSPLDARAQGPNDLLRSGAVLTETARDILTALEPSLSKPLAESGPASIDGPPPPPMDETALAQARVLVGECLGASSVTVDEIIRQCQLSPAVVSMVLLELDLAGRLERQAGNRVAMLLPPS